jgi:hypothetical protein
MALQIPQTIDGVNRLLDLLKSDADLKNDAALSRALDVAPPVISKLRSGRLPLGASMLLQVHEVFELPVAEIKARLTMGQSAAAK